MDNGLQTQVCACEGAVAKFACPWCGHSIVECDEDLGVAMCDNCRNLVGHYRVYARPETRIAVWRMAKYSYLTISGYCLVIKRPCVREEALIVNSCENCEHALDHLQTQIK